MSLLNIRISFFHVRHREIKDAIFRVQTERATKMQNTCWNEGEGGGGEKRNERYMEKNIMQRERQAFVERHAEKKSKKLLKSQKLRA